MPELELPSLTSQAMRLALEQACWGKSSFGELSKVKLSHIVSGLLSYAQQKALDTHAPAALEVPSGKRHRLQYSGSAPPVLAVRIQELFGWMEVPRLANGQIAVTLHLLAPNYRPQQVTSDLLSFWKTTYPEVRKELRARYPKHAWPEDPFVATAQLKR
jgi:ATP-dependent helicase HrpB